jgi:hypothetical protein
MELNTTPPNESGQPELKRRELSAEEKAKRAERARNARAAKTQVVEGVKTEAPRVYVSHGVKIPQIIPVRRRTSIVNIRA